jgi:hypothetical protein
MPASEVVSYVVAALGTGGIGKFAYDLITARSGGRKSKVEGSVILVDSAAKYAQGLVERIDRMDAEFEAYRREQDLRSRAQEALFRAHVRWDLTVQAKLEDLGESVPDPPPLYAQ